MYSLDEIRQYCKGYGKRKLVLDTNLFLLLLVGRFDKEFLGRCQSTKKYSIDDYELMLKIFRYFESEIIVTPYVLAEISNLSRRDIKKPKVNYFFQAVVSQLKECKEEYVSLEKLLGVKIKVLAGFGFPDMSIIEVAEKMGAVIFTDELSLCLYANSLQIANINFRNIKASYLTNNYIHER